MIVQKVLNEIKRICGQNEECDTCPFCVKGNGSCHIVVYKEDIAPCDWDVNELLDEIRVADLLNKGFKKGFYVACEEEYIYDKCDKCDEKRMIHFKSPQGNDCSEPCNCSRTKYRYFVQEPITTKVVIKERERQGDRVFMAEYEIYDWLYGERDYIVYNSLHDQLGDNAEQKDYLQMSLNPKKHIFFDRGKAQKFCDWLNTEGRGIDEYE